MKNIKQKIAAIDWQKLTEDMHERGYALVQTFCLTLNAQNS